MGSLAARHLARTRTVCDDRLQQRALTSAPVGGVGEVAEVVLLVGGERAAVFGRRQNGLLGGELLVEVTHVLDVFLPNHTSTM